MSQPTDDDKDKELRQKLYSETRADLLKRQLSNSENADRAVLTVSTASLGFSLAFLKDIIPLVEATYINIIYVSWLCFVTAIIFTIISFFTSQKAIEDQLDYARRYYLAYEDEVLALNSKFNKATNWINILGIIFLVIGLILNSLFVFINYEKVNTMKNKDIYTMDGAILNRMQPVSVTKGATTTQGLPVMPQGGVSAPPSQQTTTLPKTTDK